MWWMPQAWRAWVGQAMVFHMTTGCEAGSAVTESSQFWYRMGADPPPASAAQVRMSLCRRTVLTRPRMHTLRYVYSDHSLIGTVSLASS